MSSQGKLECHTLNFAHTPPRPIGVSKAKAKGKGKGRGKAKGRGNGQKPTSSKEHPIFNCSLPTSSVAGTDEDVDDEGEEISQRDDLPLIGGQPPVSQISVDLGGTQVSVDLGVTQQPDPYCGGMASDDVSRCLCCLCFRCCFCCRCLCCLRCRCCRSHTSLSPLRAGRPAAHPARARGRRPVAGARG